MQNENYPNGNYQQNKGTNPLLIVLIVIGVILVLGIGLLVGLNLGSKGSDAPTAPAVAVQTAETQPETPVAPAPASPAVATPAPTPVSTPAPAPKAQSVGVFHEGQNVMNGIFYYNGGEYGFVLTLNISNGSIKSASYYPKNQGAKTQTLKGGSCYITPDGDSFTVTGKAHGSFTVIEAGNTGGKTFYGSMQRGDHYGEVKLTLK